MKRWPRCVGRHGSMVVCVMYKQEIADCMFNPWLRWICSNVVLLGKALCSHVRSLNPGVSGYLAGQWRLLCLNSSMCRKWQPGRMLPGELRSLMNEQVLWLGGNCVKSGKWCFALDIYQQTINLYLCLYHASIGLAWEAGAGLLVDPFSEFIMPLRWPVACITQFLKTKS